MLIVFAFIFVYSCIGVHLVMEPYEVIEPVNIRYVISLGNSGTQCEQIQARAVLLKTA